MIGKLIPLRRTTGEVREMTDEALLAACAARDPSALAALFDRHGRVVHRFLVRLRGVDDPVADDLVQDSFLHAYESARRFKGGAAVRTWLLAIAGNLAKVHVRSEIRRGERAAVFVARSERPQSRPDGEAELRELVGQLGDALAALPHDQRVAFLLCDVEEERGLDVARALGIREGTLYRRLHDARKALRAALRGDEE